MTVVLWFLLAFVVLRLAGTDLEVTVRLSGSRSGATHGCHSRARLQAAAEIPEDADPWEALNTWFDRFGNAEQGAPIEVFVIAAQA